MGERNKEAENCFIFACVDALPGKHEENSTAL